MTDTTTTLHAELGESREKLVPLHASTEAQALITEQQVLFSTAAAVALPPARTHRWSDSVHAAVSAVGAFSSQTCRLG